MRFDSDTGLTFRREILRRSWTATLAGEATVGLMLETQTASRLWAAAAAEGLGERFDDLESLRF